MNATRAQATQAAGSSTPIDGRGRTVDVIDFIPEHGQKAASAINDKTTGIAPGANVPVTITDVRNPDPALSMPALVHDTKAWAGKQDPAAVAKTVSSAEAAMTAGKGTPKDHATLNLAAMAANMAAFKSGREGHSGALTPINANTPSAANQEVANLLNKPGTNPVARAAVEAANDWAASPASALGKGAAAGMAPAIDAFGQALSKVKNPDPSKPAFASLSVGVEPSASAAQMAGASFVSPQWRAQNGLGAVGASTTPQQDAKANELFLQRRNEIGAAAETAATADPKVQSAVKNFDSVAKEKLDKENIGTVLSTGNRGSQPGSTNFLDTPNVLSVGATTDAGEPFRAGDRTMASFSNEKGDVAAPGLVVAPGPDGKPAVEPGTSFSTPYAAGAAALVSQAAPKLSARQVLDVLRSTAAPATGPRSGSAGAGVIDVPAAIKKARESQGSE